ncbi:hypothetical protein C8Q78DRAFT_405404 [Trametes maxima]|nr:hypothetical protein C8Q78DRAFT_405404 [Trametes maxima]
MSSSEPTGIPINMDPEAANPSPGPGSNQSPETQRANVEKATRDPPEEKPLEQGRDQEPGKLTLKELIEDRKNTFTDEEKNKAWTSVAAQVERHSETTVERWNKEIDTYLVFAGLFSAILTAFNVQSYQSLQPTPPDHALATVAALQRISAQLSSFATSSTFVNSTTPAFQNHDAPPTPVPQSAIWLNGLWFTSLILSLASSSLCIMVKQWLNEFSSPVQGTIRETARLRQYRLENLERWHVGFIVMTIPVLLQIALALFLAGLLVLLYPLHRGVASVSAGFVGMLGMFTFITMALPVVKPGCSYKSPLALVFFRIAMYTIYPGYLNLMATLYWIFWRIYANTADGSVAEKVFYWLSNALEGFEGYVPPTGFGPILQWHIREKYSADKSSDDLDCNAIATAYKTTMTPHSLSTAATCVVDLPPLAVVCCFEQLHEANTRHFGPNPYKAVIHSSEAASRNLWTDCLICFGDSAATSAVLPKATAHESLVHYLEILPCWDEIPNTSQECQEIEKILLGMWAFVTHVPTWKAESLRYRDVKSVVFEFVLRVLRKCDPNSNAYITAYALYNVYPLRADHPFMSEWHTIGQYASWTTKLFDRQAVQPTSRGAIRGWRGMGGGVYL